jgi:tetratricopeptide (TPR) repeat protein
MSAVCLVLVLFGLADGFLTPAIGQENKQLAEAQKLIEGKQYAEAVAKCSEVIRASRDDWDRLHAYLGRGLAYALMGENHKALSDFSYLIDRKVADRPFLGLGPVIYFHRASVYSNLNQYDKAISDLSRMVEVCSAGIEYETAHPQGLSYLPTWNRELVRALDLRARLLTEAKDYENAVNDYTRALEAVPHDTALHRQRADLYRILGNTAAAAADDAAVQRLKVPDQGKLAAWVGTTEPSERVAAIEGLTDQTFLAQIAKTDPSTWVRRKAVSQLTDQTALADIAKSDAEDGQLRVDAIARLADQALLAEIAKTATDWSIRTTAVRHLTDQAVLAQIAKTDPEELVRNEAKDRIKELRKRR